jgi:hypothetical protein
MVDSPTNGLIATLRVQAVSNQQRVVAGVPVVHCFHRFPQGLVHNRV